jgi:cephalosporin-C deacetylase
VSIEIGLRPARVGAVTRSGQPYDRSDPQGYGTSVTKPEGYDAFWQETWDRLQRIPLDPSIAPVALRSTSDVAVYEGHYTSWEGLRIACWYCVPSGPGLGAGGRHPAIAFMPGYVSEPPLGTGKEWARHGFACVVAAPRGKLRSNAVFNPGYPGLLTHNLVDHQTYGYRGFYCDAWRAIDFLLSRPEVDQDRIGVTGSSQGGGLSIAVAAWRDEVKAACPGAPYLCGMRDAINLTHTYPYEEINDYLRTYPDREESVLRTLDLYDGINFAPRVSCPTLMNIGLVDPVCPPETGYAVFGALGAEIKDLHAYPGQGHSAGGVQHAPHVHAWMRRFLDVRQGTSEADRTGANVNDGTSTERRK